MSLKEYEDFVFGAVHAHEEDPIALLERHRRRTATGN